MAGFRQQRTEGMHRGLGRLFAPAASVAAARGLLARLRGQLGMLWFSSALLIGGAALGVIVSTQWQSQVDAADSSAGAITRQTGSNTIAGTIHRLEAEQSAMKSQIAALRNQLSSAQTDDTNRRSALTDVSGEVDKQRIAAGMVAVQGVGVIATFDDSSDRTVPDNEDPAKYILHDYDLRDVLSTLWQSGAEAVSVNGERIVSNTSLYCVGTTIIANSTRLSPPYEIHAIGDPKVLEPALRGSSQMEKLNQRAQVYDLPIKIEPQSSVLVPAYNGSFVYKYAKVEK